MGIQIRATKLQKKIFRGTNGKSHLDLNLSIGSSHVQTKKFTKSPKKDIVYKDDQGSRISFR